MDRIYENRFEKEFNDAAVLKGALNMYFDINCRFLACYGVHSVNIISLEESINKVIQFHRIHKRFSRIVDVQLVSTDLDSYRCDIACQSTSFQNVIIYTMPQDTVSDTDEAGLDYKRQIAYLSEKQDEKIKAKISDDFRKVALSYGNENYILFIGEDGNYQQRII